MMRFHIKQLETLADFRACERIQEAVWGGVGVSAELMSVTQKYGGAVIGALLNRRVIGFIYALLARRRGQLIHWSHLMAVEPEHRDLGLGFRMKLAHRRLALAQKIKSICWTFDALQSRNAALNLRRLGAQAEEYIPNCYGRFSSVIESGLESDRFVVNWRIGSAWVLQRISGLPRRRPIQPSILKAPSINQTRMNSAAFPENKRIDLNLRHPTLLFEIPGETDRMRGESIALARRWRYQTRRIILGYFAQGYRVVDFVPPGAASSDRCFYVLRRRAT